MRRRTFDLLASVAGLVLVVVLAAAGGLLTWGHSFVDNQVSTQLSAQSIAQPNNTKLAGLVDTVFKGTTLRGMLLNAYAFWQMGVIALWGAIVSFIGAGLLLILSFAGLLHARWTPATAEILPDRQQQKITAS
jgi:hypothetical protein